MSSLKVHIVGASGSGTTTLARALAPELGAIALDSDDYYWLPTQPPFTDRRDRALRHQLVMADLACHPRAILSGAIIGWGDDLEHAFDLVIFLSLPHELRCEGASERGGAGAGGADDMDLEGAHGGPAKRTRGDGGYE